MNEILDGTYYIVHGWIKNQLRLKGVKKDVYAIIYGFSQDGETEFKGSVKYLAEWLDCSRQTIMKALQELTESGLLIKRVEIINNVQFNRYKANLQVVKNFYGGSKETLQGVKKFDGGSQKTLQGGSQKTLHNNDNISKEKDNNIYIIAERVLLYLNEKAGTGFKPVESNLKFIVARLKDYSENDLKAVIDKKVKEWKRTKMQAYLRPETLFNATKFESYKNGLSAESKNFANEREYTEEELNGLLDNVDDIKF